MSEENKLSRKEIESLLDNPSSDKSVSQAVLEKTTDTTASNPVLYNFNKPYSISVNFEKNLLSMCEGYAREATQGLTRDYRTNCSVEFNGLIMKSFDEYHSSLPNPTCISTIALPPLKGQALMHIDLNLAFALVKKMLGGRTEDEDTLRRFTDIEMGIAGSIAENLLTYLKEASSKFATISPEYLSIEANPEYLNTPATEETMILLSFEVAIRDVKGKLTFCIPSIAFEPVKDQFDPEDEFIQRDTTELAQEKQDIHETIEDTKTELVVKMAEFQFPFSKIEELESGSLIDLGTGTNESMELELQGKSIFQCKAGQFNGNRAVELTKKITEEK
jgi:flagellar motor switch protein FliM